MGDPGGRRQERGGPQTRAILDELRDYTGGSEWVLERPIKPGTHLTTSKTAYQVIFERAGMRPWSPHDLAADGRVEDASARSRPRTVQGILNHKDRSVTAMYDRYGADPEKQGALTEWGRRVADISAGGTSCARVVVDFSARAARRS